MFFARSMTRRFLNFPRGVLLIQPSIDFCLTARHEVSQRTLKFYAEFVRTLIFRELFNTYRFGYIPGYRYSAASCSKA
jgi:hypothetical protein